MINYQTWDKTNIGENYPGVTLPLTYSFIRSAYKEVYPNFLGILGLKKSELEKNQFIFSNMLGYVKGEVFYNIDNWYRLIKLLPGYSLNKGFFENMLDPVERDDSGLEKKKLSIVNKFLLIPIMLKFIYNIVFIKRHYVLFDRGYYEGLKYFESLDLHQLSNDRLVNELEKIKKYFFSVWSHTIVNDFRVMVFFGLYSKILSNNTKGDSSFVANQVYGINSKPESVLLLRSIIKIALLAKKEGIESTSVSAQISEYISKYGERSFNELKLEEHNFKENPDQFKNIIRYYVQMPEETLVRYINTEMPQSFSDFNHPWEHIIRGITIKSIHKREEFRLKRAKVFNIAKKFFIEMGNRLLKEDLIDSVDDIYYLYQSEILDTLGNHTLAENLSPRIAERKLLIKEYAKSVLPRRVRTEGVKIKQAEYTPKKEHAESPSIKVRITSSGDIIKGEIVTMSTLDFNIDVKNKVLVTHATDPGWTILFPLLKGVIIEEGGMLSHASIVARELGIPCAILPHALSELSAGDTISLDSKSGTIKVTNHAHTK